jgi:HEAT repeat protein
VDVRRSAAGRPVEPGDPQAVEPLIKALADGALRDAEQGAAAAQALGRLGDRRAVAPLVRLLGHRESILREAVALALAELGEPEWREIVKGDEEDLARLGASRDPRAVEPLLGALSDEDEPLLDERSRAAEALGELGDPRAVAPLIEALDVGNSLLRFSAAEALGRLGDTRAVEPLTRALSDGHLAVRRRVIEALEKLGDSRAVEPLIDALTAEGSDSAFMGAALMQEVRCALVRALGRLGDPRAIAPLIEALRDPADLVRGMAIEALAILDPGAVDLLVLALQDRGEITRRAAADALGRLGHPRAIEPLIQVLGDGEPAVRRAAAGALERLHEPVWQGIVRGDVEDFERLAAALDPRAVEPLVQALHDPRARALTRDLDEEDAVAELKAMCTFVQCMAAEALGHRGDSRAAEALIRALRDRNDIVRGAAELALGVMGPCAIEALIAAAESGDPGTREAAGGALERIRSGCAGRQRPSGIGTEPP